MRDVLIIGAGAAGMMAAISAAENGARVRVFEKNPRTGRKLCITGKGRCNVTNLCTADEFMRSIASNGKFLYSAFTRFPPESVMDFFTRLNVPMKVERGSRVFPASDSAYDINDALNSRMSALGAELINTRVTDVVFRDGAARSVLTGRGEFSGDAVIVATGGVSYPGTGSTGDGYRFAEKAGHRIIPPKASLVPLVSPDAFCADMQGLSLRNVTLSAEDTSGKTVYSGLGELLFTHFGLSGPLVLSASAYMRDLRDGNYTIIIDLKPGLSEEKLDARVLRDFSELSNSSLKNALTKLLHRRIIPHVLAAAGLSGDDKVHSVTRAQRRALTGAVKRFSVRVSGFRPIEEAIITAGGVDVSEVNPGGMESRLVRGLHFAGETLDLDALTGGFNLQIAWSTGLAAGQAASRG